MAYEMFIRAVASILVTLGVVTIFLLVEAYLELERELPARHPLPHMRGSRTSLLSRHKRP